MNKVITPKKTNESERKALAEFAKRAEASLSAMDAELKKLRAHTRQLRELTKELQRKLKLYP